GHPAPAGAPPGAVPVSAEAVAAARKQRDAADAARTRAERAHARLTRQAAEQAAVAAGHTPAGITAEEAEVARRLAGAEASAARLPALEAELADLRDRQERLAEELRVASAAEATALQEAHRARSDLSAVRADVVEAAAGYPSVAARHEALMQASAA